MLAIFNDTGMRESVASCLISIGGNNGRNRLFLYFYLLLVGVSIVLGKDFIIRECPGYPTKIGARVINGVVLLHNTTVTCLVAVAWLTSGFAASNTTNKHMVGTFHDVKRVTVSGGTFITNLTDVPAQVQSSGLSAQQDPCSGEQEVGPF